MNVSPAITTSGFVCGPIRPVMGIMTTTAADSNNASVAPAVEQAEVLINEFEGPKHQ
ncbi:hypothetical protein RUM44_005647 [Polyplax serrata]|uniref:Uncharacterized protein n=1 Tax=Polyplax serrata TaxID=468196 RepID=A0ABR1AE09_POLSC